jgi:hypothetical protein
MSAPNPFDLYEMNPAPAPTNVCPTCGKTFKQLKQHITKMHNRYVIRIVIETEGIRAYMSFNGEPEVEGEQPYDDDEEDECEWYPDGSDGVETISLRRNILTGETKVYRHAKGKKQYLHNIKIQ